MNHHDIKWSLYCCVLYSLLTIYNVHFSVCICQFTIELTKVYQIKDQYIYHGIDECHANWTLKNNFYQLLMSNRLLAVIVGFHLSVSIFRFYTSFSCAPFHVHSTHPFPVHHFTCIHITGFYLHDLLLLKCFFSLI